MTTTIHIKTDSKVKARAERFAKANNMTLTTFINLSIHQVLNRGQLIIDEPLVPNAKTAKELKRILKDADAGKNMSPVFNSIEEMDTYLDSLH